MKITHHHKGISLQNANIVKISIIKIPITLYYNYQSKQRKLK